MERGHAYDLVVRVVLWFRIMDITYKAPFDFEPECKMLEKNYVTCLHEKSRRDDGVPMKCDVERVRLK